MTAARYSLALVSADVGGVRHPDLAWGIDCERLLQVVRSEVRLLADIMSKPAVIATLGLQMLYAHQPKHEVLAGHAHPDHAGRR